MSMVIRVVSVGGCSRQYESCLQHKCHLVLGVSPITMMKCCRPRGYPGAGHHGGWKQLEEMLHGGCNGNSKDKDIRCLGVLLLGARVNGLWVQQW